MKKVLLSTVVFIAVRRSVSVWAADLAARQHEAPPQMIAAVYDWSGFYVGVNGGWGTSRKLENQHRGRLAFRLRRLAEGRQTEMRHGGINRWSGPPSLAGFLTGVGLEAQGNWADFNGSRR